MRQAEVHLLTYECLVIPGPFGEMASFPHWTVLHLCEKVFEYFFQPCPIALLLLETDNSFVIVPQVPEALFFFSFSFFGLLSLCSSYWVISTVLSSSSLILLHFLHSTVEHIHWAFILIIVVFSSKISILVIRSIYVSVFRPTPYCFGCNRLF